MTRRCGTGWLASVLVLAGLLSPGVGFGAAPTFERIEVDDTFVDEQLSEACGVTATVTLQGQITLRTFADKGTGLVTLNTLNLAATITADGARSACGTLAEIWSGSSPTERRCSTSRARCRSPSPAC